MARNRPRVFFLLLIVASSGLFSHEAEAAADIALASPALAADGITLTSAISGGNGAYSPTTGVTGVTVKMGISGSPSFPIASTRVSGATLTITLGAFIPSGQTVNVSIAASSNLTDSANDTPQGQNGLSVANNSSKTVSIAPATSTAISYYGTVSASGSSVQFVGGGAEAVFIVNGTDADAFVQASSATGYTVSIDGGAATTPAIFSTNIPVAIDLFSGLPAGEHLVDIKKSSGGSFLISSGGIQTAGGTGSYRAPGANDGIGYGPYLRLSDPSFPLTGNTDNLVATSYFGATNVYSTTWPNGIFRVKAETSTLKVWAFLNGSQIVYNVDGVYGGTITLPNTQNFGFVTLATGLDNSSFHTYTITSASTRDNFYIDAVMLVGSSVSYASSSVPTLPGISGYGDSITQGIGVTDLTKVWLYEVSQADQETPFNRGVGGTTVIARGQSSTTDITSIVPEISKNFVLYGTNDITGDESSPTSAFSSAYQTMLLDLLANSTHTIEYVIGIIPRSVYSPATIAAWNGSGYGIQGSIAAFEAAHPSYASRIVYIDSSRWNLNGASGTDYTTNYADGTHPNNPGNAIRVASLKRTPRGKVWRG